jgi:hypothetical protein
MTTPPAPTLDPDEVQVGTPNGPGIWLAPAGTDPPDDTTEEYESPWRLLGYLSEDGPTVGQDTSSEPLTPWQSVAPIRTVITERQVTLQFVLWQLNAMTLGLYFDTDEPTAGADGAIDMEVRTDQAGHLYAVSIDSRDGERVLRLTFTRANLSDAGDMPITRGAVVPLDCTLSALEDAGSLARVQLGPATDGSVLGAPSPNGSGVSAGAAPPARRRRKARAGGGSGEQAAA